MSARMIALAAATLLTVLSVATPASAQWGYYGWHDRGWREQQWREREWRAREWRANEWRARQWQRHEDHRPGYAYGAPPPFHGPQPYSPPDSADR